jgi:hypothetical protein
MRLLVLWNGQGKNEGSGISHCSRSSPPFDRDLKWSNFRRRSICVPWVEDPVNLRHWERLRVLFWIK